MRDRPPTNGGSGFKSFDARHRALVRPFPSRRARLVVCTHPRAYSCYRSGSSECQIVSWLALEPGPEPCSACAAARWRSIGGALPVEYS